MLNADRLVLVTLAVVKDGEIRVSLKAAAHPALATPQVVTHCTTVKTMHGSSPASVGIVYDSVMELHLREDHSEHPSRIIELQRSLEAAGLLARCRKLTSKLASNEELLRAHSQAHINKVEQMYSNPIDKEGQPAEKRGDTYIITSDIYCNQHTATAARSAAGCSIQAVESVLSGEVGSAFAIVRPPGHHAESEELMGFCFYNNVAVAAHAALQHPGIQRIAIVDWDIHHGNGTQQIFEADDRVLFISLHRRDGDFYPAGCGFATEVGTGKGTGFTVNIPWSSKGVGDADYLAAMDLVLAPILAQFAPQLLLISAGFDAAAGDFLGKCCVSPAGFAAMTHRLQRAVGGGKVVAVLEGGYVPSIVGECCCAVMQVLLGDGPPPLPQPAASTFHRFTRSVLAKIDSIQRQHWSLLAEQPPFTAAFQGYSSAIKLQSLSVNSASGSGHGTRAAMRAAAAATAATAAAAAGSTMQESQQQQPLEFQAGVSCWNPLLESKPGVSSCNLSRPLASCAPTLRGGAVASSSSSSSSREKESNNAATLSYRAGAGNASRTSRGKTNRSSSSSTQQQEPLPPPPAAAVSVSAGPAPATALAPPASKLKIKIKIKQPSTDVAAAALRPALATASVMPAPAAAASTVTTSPQPLAAAAAAAATQQQIHQHEEEHLGSVAVTAGEFHVVEAPAAANSSVLEPEVAAGACVDPQAASVAELLEGLMLASPTPGTTTAATPGGEVAAAAAASPSAAGCLDVQHSVALTAAVLTDAITTTQAPGTGTSAPVRGTAAAAPAAGVSAGLIQAAAVPAVVAAPREPTDANSPMSGLVPDAVPATIVPGLPMQTSAVPEPVLPEAADLAELLRGLHLASSTPPPCQQQQAPVALELAGCGAMDGSAQSQQQPASQPRQWVLAAAALALPDD